MAQMEFHGMFRGREVDVDWEDGILVAAPFDFRDEVGDFMAFHGDIPLTAEGPAVPASIDDPVSAYVTISECFDQQPAVRGDIPNFDFVNSKEEVA
jgi:hypothetical protein